MPPGVQFSTASAVFSRFLNRNAPWGGLILAPGPMRSAGCIVNLAGMDYQGQVSSGYGRRGDGRSWRATQYFRFHLSLDLLARFERMPRWTCRQRTEGVFRSHTAFPQALVKSHLELNPLTRQYETKWRQVWAARAPLCLLGLEGFSGEITLHAGVQAGAEIPFPSLGDELGINVSAQAGASRAHRQIHPPPRGAYSGAVPSPRDVNLGLRSDLDRVVEYLFSQAPIAPV